MDDKAAYALTYRAVDELKSALDAATTPYDFLADADSIIGRAENQLALPLDFGVAERLDAGSAQGYGRDAGNAPKVYEHIGVLDRSNAADRRLWTYLAFSTYREYMESRWPLEGRKWKSRVLDRWLMLNNSRGKLVRHGISRLWWVTSLTHDPQRRHPLSLATGDQFAYTHEAFRNEDRINALFDREAGAIPAVVRMVLEHAAQGGDHAKDDHMRGLMKELTLVHGYRDLASLDPDNLDALVKRSALAVKETM